VSTLVDALLSQPMRDDRAKARRARWDQFLHGRGGDPSPLPVYVISDQPFVTCESESAIVGPMSQPA